MWQRNPEPKKPIPVFYSIMIRFSKTAKNYSFQVPSSWKLIYLKRFVIRTFEEELGTDNSFAFQGKLLPENLNDVKISEIFKDKKINQIIVITKPKKEDLNLSTADLILSPEFEMAEKMFLDGLQKTIKSDTDKKITYENLPFMHYSFSQRVETFKNSYDVLKMNSYEPKPLEIDKGFFKFDLVLKLIFFYFIFGFYIKSFYNKLFLLFIFGYYWYSVVNDIKEFYEKKLIENELSVEEMKAIANDQGVIFDEEKAGKTSDLKEDITETNPNLNLNLNLNPNIDTNTNTNPDLNPNTNTNTNPDLNPNTNTNTNTNLNQEDTKEENINQQGNLSFSMFNDQKPFEKKDDEQQDSPTEKKKTVDFGANPNFVLFQEKRKLFEQKKDDDKEHMVEMKEMTGIEHLIKNTEAEKAEKEKKEKEKKDAPLSKFFLVFRAIFIFFLSLVPYYCDKFEDDNPFPKEEKKEEEKKEEEKKEEKKEEEKKEEEKNEEVKTEVKKEEDKKEEEKKEEVKAEDKKEEEKKEEVKPEEKKEEEKKEEEKKEEKKEEVKTEENKKEEVQKEEKEKIEKSKENEEKKVKKEN